MEQPCHAMNTSKNNSYAEGNRGRERVRITIREHRRVKCGHSEGRRITKGVGPQHIDEAVNKECGG